MIKSAYEIMLRFHVEALMELFFQRFYDEYGGIKLREVNNKVVGSQKVVNYIQTVGENFYRPTSKGITSVLNTVPYFIFSKGETLCTGGLLILQLWNNEFNQNMPVLKDEEVTKVAADIIIDCYKIKFNKAESLFSRFFMNIRVIEKGESNHSENSLSNQFDFNDDFDYGDKLE